MVPWPYMMEEIFGRGVSCWGKFCGGGGEISPPLKFTELQLPHAHPNVQAVAPFRVRKIRKSNYPGKQQ